jgi:peptidyl-prolyl cis-trans isomerase D
VVPKVDFDAADVKKLKETLQGNLTEEQVTQYVHQLEKDLGTSINEAAVAQVTGANEQ